MYFNGNGNWGCNQVPYMTSCCCNSGWGYGGYSNQSNYSIILVLFILLVIIIGSRFAN